MSRWKLKGKGLLKMNGRNEKLKKLMRALSAGVCCMAAAGILFWAAPVRVQAVPLGSNPNGTLPAGEDAPADSGEEGAENGEGQEMIMGEGGGEAAGSAAVVTSATVTEDRVNVRSDASTSASVAGKATRNMELTVTGEKADSSGTTWYAVTFESEGNTVNGYIRSDMVEVHMTEPAPPETEPVPEEQPEDTSDPAPAVPNDFFVQYEDDGTGTGTNAWYLYDGIMGNKYRVDTLLGAEDTNQSNQKLLEEETGKFKMIIIVMAVVILILIIVLTVLIIKLRNSDDDDYDYDDDDEDDEDDDEEEDYGPRKRRFGRLGRRRDEDEEDEDEDEEDEDEEEEEYRPVKKAPARRAQAEKAPRRARYEEEDEDEEEPVRRSAKNAKSNKNWQSKNFLDDDDLEFEFLDLK